MTTITTAMTNTHEAIKALQAGQLDKANEYASAALAFEADQIDMRSRVLAAAISMVEIEADAKALMNMAVYNDMVDFVAEVEAQQPKERCLIEMHIEKFGNTNEEYEVNQKLRQILEAVAAYKKAPAIDKMIRSLLDQHDTPIIRMAVWGISDFFNRRGRKGEAEYYLGRSSKGLTSEKYMANSVCQRYFNSAIEAALQGRFKLAHNTARSEDIDIIDCSAVYRLACHWIEKQEEDYKTDITHRAYEARKNKRNMTIAQQKDFIKQKSDEMRQFLYGDYREHESN